MPFFKKEAENQQAATIEDLSQKIHVSEMPSAVEKIAVRELDMLSKISPESSEYTIGLAYIDCLVNMPWSISTEDNLDINRAERILNEDHYGLNKTKERIVEHLAVKVLVLKKKPQILVIDDEEIARKNLTHILEKENYDVMAVSNGMEAFKKMESTEFDIVIADLKMPGVDGMEVLEKIKIKYPYTQVIIITGYATVSSAVEAMQKGAYYYIAKPFKLEDVRLKVREAYEKKSRLRTAKGSVLCFAGPPGTGKTSMGRAIARALGRKFVRISLGGIKDEAEIRGHRRTYVGAKPGRIIEEIRRAESSNPVFMMDELDKISQEFKGDPSSALLEVLDPEQNHSFVDHYLDVPFDLSRVMFIITANVFDNIPSPLRDRMELTAFAGYTLEEKAEIASQFLIPRQIRQKGIYGYRPVFTGEAICKIIQSYTREAGIRTLERRIATVCRKIAKELLRDIEEHNTSDAINITPDLVERYLGKQKYHFEVVEDENRIGVSTGLVLTEIGGDIIFVEAVIMKGTKELLLTGSLGDVMRESAQAALSYIRSNAESLGIQEDFFEHHDVHIHVPSGAIRKDGPSAGLTIGLALISLLTRRPARRDVAMTGEITLTGKILRVGGIKEKILAARRSKIKRVIIPGKNSDNLAELTDTIKKDIDIVLVDSIDDVIDNVLLTS
jgi:ATP-dependent Lon protease